MRTRVTSERSVWRAQALCADPANAAKKAALDDATAAVEETATLIDFLLTTEVGATFAQLPVVCLPMLLKRHV